MLCKGYSISEEVFDFVEELMIGIFIFFIKIEWDVVWDFGLYGLKFVFL